MLQQTRVATVIPYYRRWLERFPTIRALADAALDDVLATWSGLGYYSRARNLHRCAREIVERHGGALPRSAAQLRDLPGIGRYTAGAIASIAFGLREPVVDGNVARVLARIQLLELDIKSSAGMRALWRLAGQMVPANAPSDFNQGLMELGATLCTPTRPNCLLCPVTDLCGARASGRQHELPRKAKRKKTSELPILATSALWVVRRGRLLLARRAPHGLYGGLWELPQTDDPARLETLLPEPARVVALESVAEHRQILSHRQLEIRVFRADVRGSVGKTPRARYSQPFKNPTQRSSGTTTSSVSDPIRATKPTPGGDHRETPSYEAFAWFTREALGECGLSSATQAIIDKLQEMYPWTAKRKSATR